jgi:hypothetical protein
MEPPWPGWQIALITVGTRCIECRDQLFRQQADTIELAAIGEHCPEARFAACVKNATHAGDLGTTHIRPIEHRRRESDLRRHRCEKQRWQIFRGHRRHRIDMPRDAWFHFIGNAHPQIRDAQRRGDFFANESAERAVLSIRATDQFTYDPTESHRQIQSLGPGLSQRLQLRDLRGHPMPIAHSLGRNVLRHLRHASSMSEHIAHGRILFAIRRVLGPVTCDGRVIVHLPSIRLNVQSCRRDRLGDRVGVEQRIAVDLAASGVIRNAAPCIDHQLSVQVCGDLHADLASATDCLGDGLLDSGVHIAAHDRSSLSSACVR